MTEQRTTRSQTSSNRGWNGTPQGPSGTDNKALMKALEDYASEVTDYHKEMNHKLTGLEEKQVELAKTVSERFGEIENKQVRFEEGSRSDAAALEGIVRQSYDNFIQHSGIDYGHARNSQVAAVQPRAITRSMTGSPGNTTLGPNHGGGGQNRPETNYGGGGQNRPETNYRGGGQGRPPTSAAGQGSMVTGAPTDRQELRQQQTQQGGVYGPRRGQPNTNEPNVYDKRNPKGNPKGSREIDPRTPLKGLIQDKSPVNLKYTRFKPTEWDDFVDECKREWSTVGVKNREDYERIKLETCFFCAYPNHLAQVCPFAWSGTWMGKARFGDLEAMARVHRFHDHRMKYREEHGINLITGEEESDLCCLCWGDSEVKDALNVRDLGGYEYLTAITEAEESEPFMDVYKRVEGLCNRAILLTRAEEARRDAQGGTPTTSVQAHVSTDYGRAHAGSYESRETRS